MRGRGVVGLILGLCALALPSEALAFVSADAYVVNGTMVVAARPNTKNAFGVGPDVFTPGGWSAIDNAGGDIAPGPGCTQHPLGHVAECAGPITLVKILAGDRDDDVTAESDDVVPVIINGGRDDDFVGRNLVGLAPGTVLGGPGDDFVSGGRGNDVLRGGSGNDDLFGDDGRDKLFGDGGIDSLDARDKFRDKKIDCGPGNDAKEKALRGRGDPTPKSC